MITGLYFVVLFYKNFRIPFLHYWVLIASTLCLRISYFLFCSWEQFLVLLLSISSQGLHMQLPFILYYYVIFLVFDVFSHPMQFMCTYQLKKCPISDRVICFSHIFFLFHIIQILFHIFFLRYSNLPCIRVLIIFLMSHVFP